MVVCLFSQYKYMSIHVNTHPTSVPGTVMFAILLIASMCCQGLALVSYGDSFITAFPENIGYFHPANSWKKLLVTALHNDTVIQIFYNGTQKTLNIGRSGETTVVTLPKDAEVHQLNYSTKSVRITSNKNITVLSVNQRKDSEQTHIVQPNVNLGKSYLIPSLNKPDFFESSVRYRSFRLLIINAVNNENQIKIFKRISTTVQSETFTIAPYMLFQFQTTVPVVKVESSNEIVVMLTHPCMETANCNCNMIAKQILPTKFQGQSYVVPSVLNMTQPHLLATSENSATLFHAGATLQSNSSLLLPFPYLQTRSQYVKASNNVSLWLISRGFIIELIPETMFSACYLLNFLTNGEALIIAETKSKDNVHTHKGLLSAAQWTAVAGTKYSSAIVSFQDRTSMIWHPTSKIAVYMLEKMQTEVIHGGPALSICEKPDLYGCTLIPGSYEVGNKFMSWTQSRQYCMTNADQLACPINEDVMNDMAKNLTTEWAGGWIGLRRSLLTTEWYWQNEYESSPPVTYTHWASWNPRAPIKGLCAGVFLSSKETLTWRTARCCTKKKPVCYNRPKYLIPSQERMTGFFERI